MNYYEILGIAQNATLSEIKSSYKQLAFRYHPDRNPNNPDSEDQFKKINEAYQVLSNDQKKTLYDSKLEYQSSNYYSNRRNRSWEQFHETYQWKTSKKYYTGGIDYKTNRKATLYAYLIVSAIAVIVCVGFYINSKIEEMRYQEKIRSRYNIFKRAKATFEKEHFEEAIQLMDAFRYFHAEEKEVIHFKKNLIHFIILKGHEYYEKKKYHKAISIYELIRKKVPEIIYGKLTLNLADSYFQIQQSNKSIILYDLLISNDFEIVRCYTKLAKIYQYLNDNKQALKYLTLGLEHTENQYLRYYGSAYYVVIRASDLPLSHYELNIALTEYYLSIKNPLKTLKFLEWIKYVWKDSAYPHILSAKALTQLNQKQEACEELKKAQQLGWDKAVKCNLR